MGDRGNRMAWVTCDALVESNEYFPMSYCSVFLGYILHHNELLFGWLHGGMGDTEYWRVRAI
jgi:hypothetical protein